ncbi:uncharacterized protein [Palaemon carinicauda]|uniref:uncharacterized protein n=1 Tax=Palaemon carinicauda TaxID=392227 RepID=UPI0035B5CC2F
MIYRKLQEELVSGASPEGKNLPNLQEELVSGASPEGKNLPNLQEELVSGASPEGKNLPNLQEELVSGASPEGKSPVWQQYVFEFIHRSMDNLILGHASLDVVLLPPQVFLEKERNPDCPGIVTHSSGNHGQAIAYAARCADLPCSVVVPKGTPKVKCSAIKSYGAKLVYCEPTFSSRKETCAEISEETGQIVIHPFDNYDVIAGQGTMAMELLEEVPDLDAILVPVSGGGMISGIAIAAKKSKHKCRVFAVEPEGKELQRSLEAKERLWSDPPRFLETIADSIRIEQLGFLTFPIVCDLVEPKVCSVDDDQMIEGMKLSFERLKLVVEAASGAAVYAGVHSLKDEHPPLRKVGVILCGGNVDLDHLPWIKRKTSY